MLVWRRILRSLGVVLNLRDPPNVPPYGWSYLDHIAAVYLNLNSPDSRADAVIRKSRDTPDDLTWGDIFLLESIVFSLQPLDSICRSGWSLRERFREIAGPSIYAKYQSSGIPTETDTPAKISLLKADLTRVLDALHWCYALIPVRERMRTNLTKSCVFMVCIYTILLAAILVWCANHGTDFLAMVTGIVYAGVIGGFVSSQRRMQSIPSDGDPLVSVFGLDNAAYYLWLSPLLGAIFAVTLWLLFVGGILTGTVFPNFVHSSNDCGLRFFHFTWNTLPKSSEDYAKLIIWSFLAGFAERLVPDSLDRLTARVTGNQADKTNINVPGSPAPNSPPPSPPPSPKADQHIDPEVVQAVIHSGEVPPHPKS